MKNIVRAFVVVLALTGAVASAKTQATHIARVSAIPVPTCPPDGSTDCGLGK